MALRNIRITGDEILRKKSKNVKEINDKIKILLDDMYETMVSNNGVGIAAPQVGILKRIVVIQIDPEGEIFEIINPEILESEGIQINSEGCLSVPGESGYVERPTYVKVKALDRNGNEIIIEGEEHLAVALSHEIDHLEGVLYTDKLVDPPEDLEEDYDDDEMESDE